MFSPSLESGPSIKNTSDVWPLIVTVGLCFLNASCPATAAAPAKIPSSCVVLTGTPRGLNTLSSSVRLAVLKS